MTNMKIAAAFLASLSFGTPSLAYGNFPANHSSYVNIQVPHNLKVNGTGLHHQRAHFGEHWDLLHQEGHMSHQIYFVNGNLCAIPDGNVTKTFGEPPFLLLADAGGCTDVSKARRAQELGAAGLVIGSKKCLCHEENCKSETDDCDPVLEKVNDDGSGASITIPVTRITKGASEEIKKAVHHRGSVLMELAWHAPRFEDKISIDFWHSVTNAMSQNFLTNLSVLANAFGENINVRPHPPLILDGKKMQCDGHVANDTEGHCYNMCTNGGRYCAVSHHQATGKEVVIESLRRICVYKNGGLDDYWKYLDQFNKLCRSDEYFTNEACLNDVYKHTKLKGEDIKTCMDDSGDVDSDSVNHLLEEALKDSKGIIETPTFWINEMPYTWPLTMTRTILEVMCSSFADGFAPHVCYTCLSCGDPVACASRSPMKCLAHDGEAVEPKHRGDSKKGGGHHVFRFLFFVALIGGAGGYVYYKKYVEDGGDGLGSYTMTHQLMSD